MLIRYNHFVTHLAISTEGDHTHTPQLSNPTPSYVPNTNAYIGLPKGMYNNIHFIKALFVIVQTGNKTNAINKRKINCSVFTWFDTTHRWEEMPHNAYNNVDGFHKHYT